MTLLEVQRVTAGYGGGPDILKGLSLAIEKGKTHCIIGPNGAGKSTLLRTICGFLHPRTGAVIFKGEQLNRLRPDQVLGRGISLVPQDRSLFPEMSVRENLLIGGYTLKDRRKVEARMARVFELFPILRERRSQRAQTLSGGEQQMLAMGRSLMLEPELIMLDEPSLGLAPQVVRQVFVSVQELKHRGITILMVEQNARRGLECADRGYVLELGESRLEGPAETLLHDPMVQQLYLGRRRAGAPVPAHE